AVMLTVVAGQAVLADRRRALEILQAQVPEVDIRGRQLAEPFLDRVLVPLLGSLGSLAKRITPVGMRDRIARQLVLAGNPPDDADKIAAFKVFGAIGGGALALGLAALAGGSHALLVAAPVFRALFGCLTPGAGL